MTDEGSSALDTAAEAYRVGDSLFELAPIILLVILTYPFVYVAEKTGFGPWLRSKIPFGAER